MHFTRRQMLVGLLGLGTGAGLPLRGLARNNAPKKTDGSPFEPDRRRALAAASERILPGALDAGVPEYLDYWLARDPFANFVQPMFRLGGMHLDRLARQSHQRAFADCKPDQQDAILAKVQAGTIDAKKFKSRPFFEHLVRFTLEGYLSHPKYGGNRDQVGWKFIGRTRGHPGCWWEPRSMRLLLKPDQGLPW